MDPPPRLCVVWPCSKERSKIIPQISGATSELQSTRFSFMASFHAHIYYCTLQVPLDWHQLIDFRGKHFSLHVTYIESLEVKGKEKWTSMIHRLQYESVGCVLHTWTRVVRNFELGFFAVMVASPKSMTKRNSHCFFKTLYTRHSGKWTLTWM